ncbi:MAG: hypothetical protein OJF49_000842 [Ktedonobacterales bacterium]|nr:MAG: hypothetical protein OJF49_000842 [Ktedonobacterales bacterium]
MEFGVCEYTLVFRRAIEYRGARAAKRTWEVARPHLGQQRPHSTARKTKRTPVAREVAQMLVVPVYSTLALDPLSYEHFLKESGVLSEALALLARLTLKDAAAVETTRRQIHSLVMAAEVQHIVDRMSA